MTDPKLNELPADAKGDFENSREAPLSEEQRAARARSRSRAGLSINDTIAADSTLSVGARGVNVSGVSAGAGAGAGTTTVTPSRGGSPAPNIVPGSGGSGVTPLATSGLTENPAPSADLSDAYEDLSYDDVSARAYDCWCRRGQPHGSPEVDWHQARQELLDERRPQRAKTAAAI